MKKMTISKLAEMTNVGVETVRFYQRKKLLRVPSSSTGVIRTYNEEDVQRIIFIKKTQELGFSLAEVKELLEINTKPRSTCSIVKSKAEEKIKELDKKIEDLLRMKKTLEQLSYACDRKQENIKQFKVQDCFNLNCNC